MMKVAIMCMALNIYHEARGEPMQGQYAVAHVVMNRMADTRWSSDVCGVISQKHQFSHTRSSPFPSDSVALSFAIDVAVQVVAGRTPDSTRGATHYHHVDINPSWASRLTETMRIGNHVFYK